MGLVIRYIGITALILTAVWIGNNPYEIKAWVALLASLATIISSDAKLFLHKGRVGSDRKLFEKFLETLPSDGSVSYFKKLDMGGRFPDNAADQFDRFYHEWNNAEHEFLDPNLEELRIALYEYIKDFLASVATNTFPTNSNVEYQRVPPEWKIKFPEKWRQAIAELEDLADQIYKTHQDLVRLARQKLNDAGT